jgi:hypothetical protein
MVHAAAAAIPAAGPGVRAVAEAEQNAEVIRGPAVMAERDTLAAADA